MKAVRVISVTKDPSGNSEVVEAAGTGTMWGAIVSIKFIAPAGTHRIDQVIELPPIEGSTRYS